MPSCEQLAPVNSLLEETTHKIGWPEIHICHSSPYALQIDGLSVVHIAFGWIIAENSVDQDFLLAFCEPARLAVEPGEFSPQDPVCFGHTGWHDE